MAAQLIRSAARCARAWRHGGTLLLAAYALAAEPGGASAAVPSDFFGVNAGTLFDEPQTTWAPQIDAMRAGGIAVVRSDASWAQAEPEAPGSDGVHHYDWSSDDAVVGALAHRGIRWYPIIDYSAPWAATEPGNFRSPPRVLDQYVAYARALAERYGAGGAYWRAHPETPALPVAQWEIWNEENGGYFWAPGPDPARYADLYLATRRAIKAADPAAQAVFGGVVPNDQLGEFMFGVLAHRPDARGQIDAVGYHPYGPAVSNVMEDIDGLRALLRAIGEPSVPIEVTETGWTTQGLGSMPDADRARNYSALPQAVARSTARVTRLLPYAWQTRETWSQPDDWFGLYHRGAAASLAGRSYVDAIREVRSEDIGSDASAPPEVPAPPPAPVTAPPVPAPPAAPPKTAVAPPAPVHAPPMPAAPMFPAVSASRRPAALPACRAMAFRFSRHSRVVRMSVRIRGRATRVVRGRWIRRLLVMIPGGRATRIRIRVTSRNGFSRVIVRRRPQCRRLGP